MSVRLLPAFLLLSGCAVGDAIGTGFAAVGDGAKYVISKVDGETTDASGDATATAGPGQTQPPAPATRAPTVESAPVAPIEVEPLT